ncbi:hypothetical protein ACIOJ9_29330 [Streptomyces sp. NPDC088175]|uniref:hypothetical protein n=1 Tax=unclassified Streptomyces TaxID=2593676 RepID=UPI0038183598
MLLSAGEQQADRVLGDEKFLGDGGVVDAAAGELGGPGRPVVDAVRGGYVGGAGTQALAAGPVAVPDEVGLVGLLAAGAALQPYVVTPAAVPCHRSFPV